MCSGTQCGRTHPLQWAASGPTRVEPDNIFAELCMTLPMQSAPLNGWNWIEFWPNRTESRSLICTNQPSLNLPDLSSCRAEPTASRIEPHFGCLPIHGSSWNDAFSGVYSSSPAGRAHCCKTAGSRAPHFMNHWLSSLDGAPPRVAMDEAIGDEAGNRMRISVPIAPVDICIGPLRGMEWGAMACVEGVDSVWSANEPRGATRLDWAVCAET